MSEVKSLYDIGFEHGCVKAKEEMTVLRKQILVVNIDCIMREEDRKILIENIKRQMKDGVVVLPVGVKGFTVDTDYLVVK